MNWIRLRDRRGVPPRGIGMTGGAILAMMASRFNVTETFFLPASACHRALAGAGSLSEARQALEKYDFHADTLCFAQLIQALSPDVTVWCSPHVPRGWSWLDPETFAAPTACHGIAELQEAVRAAWLKMLDPDLVRQARDAGIAESSYLSAMSMAVVAQPTELHPGLAGRTWSPDPGLAEPHAIVHCRLGGNDDSSVWTWRVDPTGTILDRPASSPADERPIAQSARLAALLARRMDRPCTMHWSWDGQELTLLSALPVAVHTGMRVFSRRPFDRLVSRPLSKAASDIVVRLLQDVTQDAGTLLLGKNLPEVPPDAALVSGGRVYLDWTFVQTVLQKSGLPPEGFDSLLQRGSDSANAAPAALLHVPRAALAVRLAVPRLERWVGDNRTHLATLDSVNIDAGTVSEVTAQLRELLAFMRPLVLDLLLLLVSSSLRSNSLGRSLARHHLEQYHDEALAAASDTAGLNPWSHLDRIAASIPDQAARQAAEALSRGDPDEAMRTLGSDVTILRDLEAFMRSFAFFRTAVIDVGSPTLRERADLLPVALLRARETGAAARVAAARDPMAWLTALPGGTDPLLRRRYLAVLRTSAAAEKAWFYLAKSLSRARMLLLHAGDLLVLQGQLDSRDEVMMLGLADLERPGDLHGLLRERAAARGTEPDAPEVIIVSQSAQQEEPPLD